MLAGITIFWEIASKLMEFTPGGLFVNYIDKTFTYIEQNINLTYILL